MVSTLGSFGIVGVGLIGSEFGVAFCETSFVKSDRSLYIIYVVYYERKYYFESITFITWYGTYVRGCVLQIIKVQYMELYYILRTAVVPIHARTQHAAAAGNR